MDCRIVKPQSYLDVRACKAKTGDTGIIRLRFKIACGLILAIDRMSCETHYVQKDQYDKYPRYIRDSQALESE